MASSVVDALKAQLKQQGYDVSVIDVAPPYRLTQPLLIKSPALFDDAYIGGIVTSLQQHGYASVDVVSMQTEQYFYNGRNVGVYLPSQVNVIMPMVMQSEDCGQQYIVLETDADAFSLDRGETFPVIKGHYTVDEQGVGAFSTAHSRLTFKLKRVQVATWNGERPADRLDIVEQINPLLPERCSFITIYDSSAP
ncbi:hypothetical protein KDN34_12675 [Shewanella yunxiaonensis]|uniref:Uncharacterized protein n=1 Tax=Shewanella yunxiaonensis TaxID=2829809 RepID=A0ABX7YR03_9GAMM|nr:hypothetical protein [Shewanella yunxiaonensis]QUN05062.1 hypothetical protein KDN34_12675 [Shewanella yunxiaonensis]